MKELTLYIDKWYIIGAVCTDGVPRLVIPDNKEDRYWLYFYEDTTNNEIVYGKDNQSHYRNNEPHYYGDIFSKMTQSDSHFLYYNRKQELCDIFKASRILASLRESMDMTETETVETYVSFSKDISDDARFLFLTKVLGQNHFYVKESVARIEHLTLEHSVRNNKLKDDGFILVLNACNENLHVSLFKKQEKDCVLQNEMVLDGYGRDLRSRALLEDVVGCINQRTNFLSSSSDLEKEYLRLEPEIDNWLVKLDDAKNGRPISLNNISLSGMTNQYAVMVLKNDIDSRTHVIVDDVVHEIDSFVKKSKVNNNEVKGVVFLGNTFTNKQFLESIRSCYILNDENYLFYRETELPNIIGVYSVIDCSQFSAETKAVMANGELELVRKQRAKEEKDRMDEAKRRNQEQQEKDKEVREAELRYNEAMEKVAAFEKKQNFAQMLDWTKIALTHRPEDKEAMAKKEEATRLLSEQKVRQQQYNSIIQRAEVSLKKHEYQDALSQSDAALNLMPSSEQAKLIHDKARKALDDIVQVKEYLTRADLFLAQKSYNEALEELRKAQSIDGHNNQIEDKIVKIQSQQESQKEQVSLLIKRYSVAISNNEFNSALDLCEQLQVLDIDNSKSWKGRENDLIRKQKEYEQKQEQIRELKEKFNGALSAENWKDVIEVGKKLLTCDKDNSVEDIIRSAEKKLRLSAVQIAFDEAFENEDWASLVQIVADNPELKTVAGNNKSIQFARRQLIFTKNSSKESGTKKTGRTKVSYPLHSQSNGISKTACSERTLIPRPETDISINKERCNFPRPKRPVSKKEQVLSDEGKNVDNTIQVNRKFPKVKRKK